MKKLFILGLITAAGALAAETTVGGTFTIASAGTSYQLSSIIGSTAKVGKITLTISAGTCYKVWIGNVAVGAATSASPVYMPNVGRILFTFGCSSFARDTWSTPTTNSTDAINPTQIYIASNVTGVQVEWSAVTYGVANSLTLTPVFVGQTQNVIFNYTTVGVNTVEFSRTPGETGKADIYACSGCTSSTPCISCVVTNSTPFATLFPTYFASNGTPTIPYVDDWTYTSATQNGINTTFLGVGEVVGEFPLLTTWKYQ